VYSTAYARRKEKDIYGKGAGSRVGNHIYWLAGKREIYLLSSDAVGICTYQSGYSAHKEQGEAAVGGMPATAAILCGGQHQSHSGRTDEIH